MVSDTLFFEPDEPKKWEAQNFPFFISNAPINLSIETISVAWNSDLLRLSKIFPKSC